LWVEVPDTTTPDVKVCLKRNDDTSSNPTGRDISDNVNKGNKLMNCKKQIQIRTFNARTLRKDDKRRQLTNNFNKCNLDILGIVDHKIVHEEEAVRIENLDRCTLITTSAWRNSNGATGGGIGILVNRQTEKALAEIKPINPRIMLVIFSGNPSTTVIHR